MCALAFVVVVVGMVVAAASVAFGSDWVEFAQGGSCRVSQQVAPPALDESQTVTCYDELNRFSKHENALLGGSLDYGVGGVHNGYQYGTGWDSEDVGGVLLPVWRHPEKCSCEWGFRWTSSFRSSLSYL